MNIIKVPHGVRNRLAEIFGVSLPTVRKALNGETDNELAKKIREAAREHKGKILTDADMESSFDTSANKWIMEFGSSAKIVADLTTGEVVTLIDGYPRRKYENPTITEIRGIQAEALKMITNN